MLKLKQYIKEALGEDLHMDPVPNSDLRNLPMYIRETYSFHNDTLYKKDIILAECKDAYGLRILQLEKHFDLIQKTLNKKVVLLSADITSINRKRLIEKGINFIVPGKQMYLPDLLIELNEGWRSKKSKQIKSQLLPSSQFILLYFILNRTKEKEIEKYTFKELSKKFDYSQMAITKAVDNLKQLDLCNVIGTKEKYLHFNYKRREMWNKAYPMMVNPVLKKVYVDEKPKKVILNCNTSALPEYTDMNPSLQEFYAIDKMVFYNLIDKGELVNVNDEDGKYCLEVWKYNPLILVNAIFTDGSVVDPLSLYLSLRDNRDERVEMALEQIKDKFIWSLD